MSGDLVFWMGRFEAHFPTDRRYARNHMWALPRGDVHRFGLTSYAVRLLQDVYFLDWLVAAGSDVQAQQELGSIESKKAESALYAPIPGRLTAFNPALLSDPSAINLDPYGAGWLLEIQGQGQALLSPPAYLDHVAAAWEIAQRTIKGQANQERGESGP